MAVTDILADKTIRATLKAAVQVGKPRKISDGGGLVMEARPTGAGWWRLRYWRDGKEGLLSLGTYPEVSLKDARRRRDDIRKLVAAGKDPSEHRKAEKAERARERESKALADAGLPGPSVLMECECMRALLALENIDALDPVLTQQALQAYEAGLDFADALHAAQRRDGDRFEQPTKFELVINLNNARALGISIPQSLLLLRADEVIQ